MIFVDLPTSAAITSAVGAAKLRNIQPQANTLEVFRCSTSEKQQGHEAAKTLVPGEAQPLPSFEEAPLPRTVDSIAHADVVLFDGRCASADITRENDFLKHKFRA